MAEDRDLDLGTAAIRALLRLCSPGPDRIVLHTGHPPVPADPGQWVRSHLEPEDQRLYDRVADLLGPAGTIALGTLAGRVWDTAEDAGRADAW